MSSPKKSKASLHETHTGTLALGNGIVCSVLDNGMRVLSASGLSRAFGSKAKGADVIELDDSESVAVLPAMLSNGRMQKYIKPELLQKLSNPIPYHGIHGGHVRHGFEADILHDVCEAFLDARRDGALKADQAHYAEHAEVLLRGFAKVGLIALIDEATGYQADRARDELQRILEAYISKELLPWTRKFPNEFFEQVYRLHGWAYKAGSARRPQCIGSMINKYIYAHLPDGVLDELRRLNPPVNGHRRHKHFQLLSLQTGNPHLDRQIVAVTTLMRAARSKPGFESLFRNAFPGRGTQMDMGFEDEYVEEEIVLPKPSAGIGGMDLQNVRGAYTHDILLALTTHRRLSARELSKAIYRDESERSQSKIRRLLTRLKHAGKVRPRDDGRWELCD